MNNQEITQADNLRCPRCRLSYIKRNGHTYYGKQNYQCKLYDRQFVVRNQTVSPDKQELVKTLLLERISLRGICRVLKVSLSWLLSFIEQLYLATPPDLQFACPVAAEMEIFCLEADELWSFVGEKENKRWIWLVLERRTRQIIALHIGDRSQDSALALARCTIAVDGLGAVGFFQYRADLVVRDCPNQLEFDAFVRQQAQRPAGVTQGNVRTSQRRDCGVFRHAARRFPRARQIIEREFCRQIKSLSKKSAESES